MLRGYHCRSRTVQWPPTIGLPKRATCSRNALSRLLSVARETSGASWMRPWLNLQIQSRATPGRTHFAVREVEDYPWRSTRVAFVVMMQFRQRIAAASPSEAGLFIHKNGRDDLKRLLVILARGLVKRHPLARRRKRRQRSSSFWRPVFHLQACTYLI